MKVIELSKEKATVSLTSDELLTLCNALNEVCNGLDVPEFATRIGVQKEEASSLLNALSHLYDKVFSREQSLENSDAPATKGSA